MARARVKEKTERQVGSGEARAHRLRLGELSDSDVVQASLDGDPRAFGELVKTRARQSRRPRITTFAELQDLEEAQGFNRSVAPYIPESWQGTAEAPRSFGPI